MIQTLSTTIYLNTFNLQFLVHDLSSEIVINLVAATNFCLQLLNLPFQTANLMTSIVQLKA